MCADTTPKTPSTTKHDDASVEAGQSLTTPAANGFGALRSALEKVCEKVAALRNAGLQVERVHQAGRHTEIRLAGGECIRLHRGTRVRRAFERSLRKREAPKENSAWFFWRRNILRGQRPSFILYASNRNDEGGQHG